jgi:hypothetical protein
MRKTLRQKADRIQGKVRSARYWQFTVLVAEQAAPLLSIVLGLRIVQVILGVRSPGMPWAAAVVLMLAWVVFRAARRLRSPYGMAQLLDAGVHLHDSFSTAWFLLENPGYATGPEIAAHIAHATTRVSEIRLHKLFPLPAKRLLVVAVLAGVVAVTGVRPDARVMSKNGAEPVTVSRIISGWFHSKQNPQKQEERELPAIASAGDEPGHNLAGSQQAQASRMNDLGEPTSDKPGAAANEDTSHMPESDRSNVVNAPARAPSESPNAGLKTSHEARTLDSGSSKASLLSQLLLPMKRLLNMADQRSQAADSAKQAANTTAPANDVASDRLQASPHGPASDQRALPPEYSSAEASAQQAAGSLPPSIGGGHPKAAPDSLDGSSASAHVIDLVDANPSGDIGHTRTLAMQNSKGGQQLYSTDSDRHADSARHIMQDDVPLAYQRSIQAYLEHTREQQR